MTAAATPFECTNPMDMFWGEDGNFYLMTYGNGFFNINPAPRSSSSATRRASAPPVAVVKADHTDGALPLTVTFSSVGSNTPEPSESITYSWDFGDGTAPRRTRTRCTPTPRPASTPPS